MGGREKGKEGEKRKEGEEKKEEGEGPIWTIVV
jgi:hypothetical protein